MKRSLLYGLIAVAVVLVLLISLPFLVPMSAYRGQIEAAGHRATGHVLKIEGPVRLSIFPMLGLQVDKVSLSNAAGARYPDLARTDRVVIAVALAPLLHGQIEVAKIVLEHPEVHLEVDAAGAANWHSAKPSVSGNGNSSLAVRLADVEIDDANLTYSDARAGSSYALDHLNAKLRTSTDGMLSAAGSFVEHGTPIDFAASRGNAGDLTADQPVPLKLSVGATDFKVSFDGTTSNSGDLDGILDLSTASLRRTLALFDRPLSSGGGLEQTKLHCRISARSNAYDLDDITLHIDQTSLRGHLAVDAAGNTPSIAGQLDADRLDLNPYIGGARESEPQPSGWSTKPISIAILKTADADLKISANALRLRQLQLGQTSLVLKIQAGRLSAKLDPIALYGGAATATLSADAAESTPNFSASLVLNNAAAARLLGDAIGVERIEGSANARLAIMAVGNSANEMMHGLAGSGAISLRNGAIRGVDLGLVARTIQSVLSGGATGQGASTRFSSLSGTFTIAGGVLRNRDFRLAGPVLNATGQGQIDLGNRSLDFQVKPVAGIGGQNGLGVPVPFRVTGSWSNPHYIPDVAGMVGGVLQTLGSAPSSLTNLLGGTGSSTTKKGQQPKKGAGDSLKNIFGIP